MRPVPVPRSSSERNGLLGERCADRLLDRVIGDVQLADAVPFGGVGAEISLRRGGARCAHRGEPLAVARDRRIGRIEPLEQRARHLGAAAMLGQAEEGPGALAEALDQAGLGQQPEMTRDARLRLAQDVGQIGDGQFGFRQQRQHAQARLLAGRLEGRVEGVEAELGLAGHGHRGSVPDPRLGDFPLYKDIFIRLNGRPASANPLRSGTRRRRGPGCSPERERAPPRRGWGAGVRQSSAGSARPGPLAVSLGNDGDAVATERTNMTTQGFRHPRRRRDGRAAREDRRRRLFHRPHPHALEEPQGLPEKRPRIRRRLHHRARSALGRRASRTSRPAATWCVLYWMDQSPRNLVLQVPGHYGVQRGTFALRSPARPNPIAMSVVRLLEHRGQPL